MIFPEPLTLVYITAGFLLLMTLLSVLFEKRLSEAEKKLFFLLIAAPVLLTTLYMAGHTVAHNMTSVTGGPIHWHADYQVWGCEERLDLIDPAGFSNKIGTPLFHEHDDDRIHVEGTVNDLADVNLGAFFYTIGGSLTETSFSYPTDDGLKEYANGALCDGQPGTIKVYVNGQRIDKPDEYQYFPHAYVPPGDCVIVDFSPGQAATTDKLCESWKAEGWTYDNYEPLQTEYALPEYWPEER